MDPVLIPVLLSILPGLLAIATCLGRRLSSWLVVVLGGAGWLMALVTRAPVLLMIRGLEPVYQLVSASLLAGVFEEGARFLLLRMDMTRRDVPRDPILLGLGWGLVEASLVYALPVLALRDAISYSWIDLMPGALERNTAIVIHVSLSLLIARNPRSIKLLAIAVLLHVLFDIIGVSALQVIKDIWLVELALAVTAFTYLALIAYPSAKHLKQIKTM